MNDPLEQPNTPLSMAREIRAALRTFALEFPGAYEDFPWGESVIKVNKKIFVFLGIEPAPDAGISIGVKLPQSSNDVLVLPFVEPSGYGLGKYGWITARLTPDDQLPIEIFRDWITESYRAVAPKRLVAQLDNNP